MGGKPCIKEKCVQWVHIRGVHPQTEKEIDMPDCAHKWTPTLMLELAQEVRHNTASVDELRNDIEKGFRHQLKYTNKALKALVDTISEQNVGIINAIHALARASEKGIIHVGPSTVQRVNHQADDKPDEDGR